MVSLTWQVIYIHAWGNEYVCDFGEGLRVEGAAGLRDYYLDEMQEIFHVAHCLDDDVQVGEDLFDPAESVE